MAKKPCTALINGKEYSKHELMDAIVRGEFDEILGTTKENKALSSVEETAKALEGKTKDLELPFFRGSGKTKDDITETSKHASKRINEKYDIVLDETEQPPVYVIKDKKGDIVSDKQFKTKDSANDEALELIGGWDKMKAEMFSEAYHKAKADGSNPELVKAVEDLLGKPEQGAAKEMKGFTEGKKLNQIYSDVKSKYGEKDEIGRAHV